MSLCLLLLRLLLFCTVSSSSVPLLSYVVVDTIENRNRIWIARSVTKMENSIDARFLNNLSFSRYVMFCKIALAIRRLAPLLFCSKKKQYQTHYFLVGGSQLILPRAREEGSNWRPGKQINVADRALDLNITSDHSRTPVSHDISCFYKTSTYLCLSFIPF
jgi:hypothetical protein